ncbi:recombinase, partial [Nakamurella silvestris]
MQEQLDDPKVVPNPDILIELVKRIRPNDTRNLEEIENKYNSLIQSLLITPNASSAFQGYLLKLVNHYKQAGLYADSGILSLDGFWNQLGQRIGAHFLPLLPDETELKDL